jgi:hypothetical protein
MVSGRVGVTCRHTEDRKARHRERADDVSGGAGATAGFGDPRGGFHGIKPDD